MARLIAAVLVALVPQVAHAANWADDEWSARFPQSRDICDRARTVVIPDPQRPDRRAEGGMAGCSSEMLYYGDNPDPKAAFTCAALEADDLFAGNAMLMTMYANGRGTGRDLDKAIAIACTLGGAPYEIDGRVRALDAMRQVAEPSSEFHWCDDITSGYAMGACAAHDQRLAAAKRDVRWAALRAVWPSQPAADKLEALIKLGRDFADSRQSEIDMSGTARAAFAIAAEEEVLDLLQKDLEELAQDQSAMAKAVQDSNADADLNAAYKRVMTHDFGDFVGAPTAKGIRSVQRKWLRYRDAWVEFAAAAFPGLPAQAVINRQSRYRVGQLLDLIGERPE